MTSSPADLDAGSSAGSSADHYAGSGDTSHHRPHRRQRATIGVLALLCIVAVFAALAAGRYTVPVNEIVRMLLGQVLPLETTWNPQEKSVVLDVRLPRVLLSLLIGAGLAVTGAACQGVFQNPLASEHILGISSGASFGGALVLLLGLGSTALVAGSFLGGVAALVLVLAIARTARGLPLLVIILAGTVVGAMFNAFVSFITYIADPDDTLPTIVFWLMGSLASADYGKVLTALVPVAVGVTVITALRWRLNILSMGDDDARSLGVDPRTLRTVLLTAVALTTAGAVAVAGVIGWVGLVVPHLARMLLGTSDNRFIIPASALLGGLYLTVVDTLSRTISPTELPIGILTAVIGAPFFIILLIRDRKQIWGGDQQ